MKYATTNQQPMELPIQNGKRTHTHTQSHSHTFEYVCRKNFYFKILFIWICVCFDILSRARASTFTHSPQFENPHCIVWYTTVKCTFNGMAFSASCVNTQKSTKSSYTNNNFFNFQCSLRNWREKNHSRSGNLPHCIVAVPRGATDCISVCRICGWMRFSNDSKIQIFCY